MGQYFKIVNLSKKEYLCPRSFDDGLKLLEFGCSALGVLTALTLLMADSNGQGGGDFEVDHPLVGSWAGDNITFTGDYAVKGLYNEPNTTNLYDYLRSSYSPYCDISLMTLAVMRQCPILFQDLAEVEISEDTTKLTHHLTGEVQLLTFSPESSFIDEVSLDNNILTINMRGNSTYQYTTRNNEDCHHYFNQFKSASSAGKFYSTVIKKELTRFIQ